MKLGLVNTPLAAQKLIAELEDATVCGFDTESAGPLLRNRKWKEGKTFINVHRSTMIGYSVGLPPAKPPKSWLKKDGSLKKGKTLEPRGYYIPLFHNKRNLGFEDSSAILGALSRVPRIWTHNLKHDSKTMLINGTPVVSWEGRLLDSYLAATTMKGGTDGTDLKSLAFELLGRESPKFDPTFYNLTGAQALEYAASDAVNTMEVGELLHAELEALGMGPFFGEVDSPFAVLLGEMETKGLRIHRGRLLALSQKCRERMAAIRSDWARLLQDPDLEIGSDAQLQELFEEGFWPDHGVRTVGGAHSVNREALEKLQAMLPEGSEGRQAVDMRLEYQGVSKIATTYTTGFIEEASQHPDGRLHPDYRQTGTKTGRLSSANPNAQNIPVRSPLGRKVKHAVIPTAGKVFVALDYSQVELRVLAHFAGGKLAEAYANNEDVHQQTADACNKIAACDRDRGKTINFALQYGASAFRLSKILRVDQQTATRVRRELLGLYPELDVLKRKLIKIADARAPRPYTKTIAGRRVFVDDLLSGYKKTREAGERKVVNSTVQGSAFDIMKIAMVNTRDFFVERGEWLDRVYFVNNLHDEMTLEVDDDPDYIAFVCAEARRVMESAFTLRVPLVAEPKVGATWLACK